MAWFIKTVVKKVKEVVYVPVDIKLAKPLPCPMCATKEIKISRSTCNMRIECSACPVNVYEYLSNGWPDDLTQCMELWNHIIEKWNVRLKPLELEYISDNAPSIT